jgi:hypothetical protein
MTLTILLTYLCIFFFSHFVLTKHDKIIIKLGKSQHNSYYELSSFVLIRYRNEFWYKFNLAVYMLNSLYVK